MFFRKTPSWCGLPNWMVTIHSSEIMFLCTKGVKEMGFVPGVDHRVEANVVTSSYHKTKQLSVDMDVHERNTAKTDEDVEKGFDFCDGRSGNVPLHAFLLRVLAERRVPDDEI